MVLPHIGTTTVAFRGDASPKKADAVQMVRPLLKIMDPSEPAITMGADLLLELSIIIV